MVNVGWYAKIRASAFRQAPAGGREAVRAQRAVLGRR